MVHTETITSGEGYLLARPATRWGGIPTSAVQDVGRTGGTTTQFGEQLRSRRLCWARESARLMILVPSYAELGRPDYYGTARDGGVSSYSPRAYRNRAQGMLFDVQNR